MNPIDAVREFLVKKYRGLISGFDSFSDGFDGRYPGWHWVNDDLSLIGETSSHGLLLDPDVGIALFLLRFNPSSNEDAGTDVRAQVAKAIAYRSRFLPCRLDEDKADENGSWRVAIHWLVDQCDDLDWQNQVSELRRDTAYMEELSVDAIICDLRYDWADAVQHHELPRLLLRTREVLGKASADSVFKWSSADERVREAMKGFSDQFLDDMERQLARKIESRMESKYLDTSVDAMELPSVPQKMQSLVVRTFRNLKEIRLNISGESAHAAIVHGPNGTGKSNLFEAVEFALGGISRRAFKFLNDPDVTTTKKGHEYLASYLSPFGREGGRPSIELNGKEVLLTINPTDGALKGNALSQEDTDRFIYKSANGLAAEILGEFSGLADDLMEFADRELIQEQANLKSMLSRLGLDRPGAITRKDTARDRVAEVQLRDSVSIAPHALKLLEVDALAWSPTTSFADTIASAMLERQRSLGDFVSGIGKLSSQEALQEKLRDYLIPVWQSRRSADQFLGTVGRLRGEWPGELARKFDAWGQWLSARQAIQTGTDSHELAMKQSQRKLWSEELETLTKKGTLLRERERHFEALQQFLRGPSLSEILCVRHTMLKRSMYAKQDPQKEAGSDAAEYPERNH